MTACSDSRADQDFHKQHLLSLIRINNITGFLPLDLLQVLHTIGQELERLFYPYKCCFLLAKSPDFNPQPGGKDHSFLCPKQTQNCRVIAEQLPLFIENCAQEEKECCLNKCGRQQKARICVPLISGVEVLGAISLKNTDPETSHQLNTEQLELLLAIANQTAATMQRARLFSSIDREKERLLQANREITALNRALQKSIAELKAAQHQLILSERLAALGHLSANVAHEINNPAGIILSRLECMELEAGELNLSDRALKDLQVIKKHVQSIAKVSRGLLAFSRQPLQEVGDVEINGLIAELVDWLAGQFAKKGIVFSLNLAELPPIRGNPEQLQQVFLNILTNARDALPAGGQISVVTSAEERTKTVRIEIADNGIGIPPDNIDRIFEPFFTTKEIGRGTGLGLAISYGIISEHGGQIRVKSEEGAGTVFTMELPYLRTKVEECGEEAQDTDH